MNENKEKNNSKIFKIIGTILLTLIAAAFPYLMNLQNIDIKYTLSERIPVNFTDESSSQNIQQLVIKNLGNSQAEKVVIDIKGKILNYELVKYAESDEVEAFNTTDGIQFIYPSIPPEGIVKVIVSTSGEEIKSVVIKHNKGIAVEALADNTNSKSVWIIVILYLGILVWFIYSNSRDILTNRIAWEAYSKGECEKVLIRDETPRLLNKQKWDQLRERAFETFLNNNIKDTIRVDDIKLSNSYKLLYEIPQFLTQKENDKVKKEAENQLEDNIYYKIFYAYETEQLTTILKVLNLEKFSEMKWNHLRNNIIKKLNYILKNSFYINSVMHVENSEVYNILAADKPEFFSDKEFSEIVNELSKFIIEKIELEIEKVDINNIYKLNLYWNIKCPKHISTESWDDMMKKACNRLIQVKKQNIFKKSITSSDVIEKINEKCPDGFQITQWYKYIYDLKCIYSDCIIRELYHSDNISNFLEKLETTHVFNVESIKMEANKIQKVQYYINSMHRSYKDFCNEEKPLFINDDDYNLLHDYLKNKDNLKEFIKSIKKNKEDLEILKNRIIRQLRFINQIFIDPNIIESIEDYDKMFSKGNFEKLKEVAEILGRK